MGTGCSDLGYEIPVVTAMVIVVILVIVVFVMLESKVTSVSESVSDKVTY